MEDIEKFYNLEYEAFIKNGIVGLGSNFTHWSLERSSNWWGLLKLSNKDLAILEVGAGNGQHLNFVKPDYYSYEMTDLRPEMLPNNFKHATVNRNSVSAENLPYPNQSFDRLIATCLLAHLNEPQEALREWKRV